MPDYPAPDDTYDLYRDHLYLETDDGKAPFFVVHETTARPFRHTLLRSWPLGTDGRA
ncbi:hypothetical protein [Plantactinospora endophytica]|uniref:Uncharacterized protein n=1 Tax=Plantactinospora endophytica TaxID=673535 RepID=A0ABQ4DUY6_9ACTN|nr:hypothetical protein [Plantactinospora endophytica]GIG86280.1 hypothetical protein Pen02_12160 [Plantactinospora endophytica]